MKAAWRRLREYSTPVVAPPGVRAWIGLTIIAAVLFWVSVPELVGRYNVPVGFAFGTCTALAGSMLLAVVRPYAATIVHVAALFVLGFTTAISTNAPWPVPITGVLTLVGFMAVVGYRQRWVFSFIVWWALFASLVLIVVFHPDRLQDQGPWGYDILVAVTLTLVALVLGMLAGQRRHIRALSQQAQRDIELEQARRQLVEERTRIARELHDVVAHSMSIVHMQAISAPFRIGDLSPAATHEFSEIAAGARSALQEMRRLMGALRPDNDNALHEPQPGIHDILELTATTRRAGHTVTLNLTGDPDGVPSVTQLTSYRIVQEALSNVIRHAPRADIAIEVMVQPSTAIELQVTNTRPVAATHLRGSGDVGGLGLIGMKERIALLSGSLEHGPTPSGGYRISAHIPSRAEINETETL